MTTETKADEFKVGDIVWCTARGKGVVEGIHTAETYPVVVYFDNGDCETYTADGRISTSDGCPRTLFFSEPKIEASVVRPFVPTLVGKKVVVLEYACYPQVFVVTWEDESMFGNDVYKCIKSNSTVYEVSSENLLTSKK